jgi:hypothetical protein
MLTANLKFTAKNLSFFFLSLQCFTLKIEHLNDSYSRKIYLRHPLLKTNMYNYVPIKHKQMSNGGKFKIYTVPKRFNFSNAYLAQDFI